VLMSHAHPDHVFGAGAFRAERPLYVGHARLPAALASRVDYDRRRLAAVLGAAATGEVVTPTRLVATGLELDLGGRVLELTAHGTAHSDCDLSVLDRNTRTLLAGDLLFVERVPSLDGSLGGWIAELARLRQSGARRAVPGHGPTGVDWPAGADDLARYLDTLRRETRQAIAAGADIEHAVQSVGRSEQDRWRLFADYHGHNVLRAYKELEWE
jgi:quinoprotein relay system zinc metallohydrolase 2